MTLLMVNKAGQLLLTSVCAMLGFIAGTVCIQEVFYRQSGNTTFHRIFCIVGNGTPAYDPIDTEEVVNINGQLAIRKITYKDGKVAILEQNQTLLFRAKIMTYGLGAAVGLLSGLGGWSVARRMSGCRVLSNESPAYSRPVN